MSKFLAWSISLLMIATLALAQSGPDNDPDTAIGYVNNVFHHSSIDSINLYNGGLTIPIPIGPSYPVGPKLKFQVMLVYNSRVWEYGNPNDQWAFDDAQYTLVTNNPALGIGWSLNFGVVRRCGLDSATFCYTEPSGAEHEFKLTSQANYYKTLDATQFYLHFRSGTNDYEMWDGDGNHYVFSWVVTGDDPFNNYIHDLGHGRSGWYLKTLTDPFNNVITINYRNLGGSTQPCWPSTMNCVGISNSWIPSSVVLPTGTINFDVGAGSGTITNAITGIRVPVPGGGQATWTLSYGPTIAFQRPFRGTGVPPGDIALQTLTSIQPPLGNDYEFTYAASYGLMRTMTLPTSGVISYAWGTYHFYKPRIGALGTGPNCHMEPPPPGSPILVSGRLAAGQKISDDLVMDQPSFGGTRPTQEGIQGGDCGSTSPLKWSDDVRGVSRRTETLAGVDSPTDYIQYAFPFSEKLSSCGADPYCADTTTVMITPAGNGGGPHSYATRFLGPPSPDGSSKPGDSTGAEVETRVFDGDIVGPTPAVPAQPACGTGNAVFCPQFSIRDTQRTFEFDTFGQNRRLLTEKTYHQHPAGDYSCTGCKYHQVAFSNTLAGTSWESNGRHYDTETHSGNLTPSPGNDARTTTTTWTPNNWTSNPFSGTPLPNLFSRRLTNDSTLTVDRYFDFNSSNGFLWGTIILDSANARTWGNCRFPDTPSHPGDVEDEFTATNEPQSTVPANFCSAWGSVPTGAAGNGDFFAKHHTYQNGLRETTNWLNSTNGSIGWSSLNVARDSTTGWVTTSTDPSNVATTYTYDNLGRVTRISPAGEASTYVCYDSNVQTTAYRNGSDLGCSGTDTATTLSWERYLYDGLGRLTREIRKTGSATFVVRTHAFDLEGHGYADSEWGACSGGASTCTSASPNSTVRSNFDPFGRPQKVVGPGNSSIATIDRTDAVMIFSDTLEKVTGCVNGTWNGSACVDIADLSPTLHSSPLTTTRKDAFGRAISVTEPTNDVTYYKYNVNDKLTCVKQGGTPNMATCTSNPGGQYRSFTIDPFGFLRKEITPEKGTVDMTGTLATGQGKYGSLGNLRQKTEPGTSITSYIYDIAGRLSCEFSGSILTSSTCAAPGSGRTLYARNYYDGAGFAGGINPLGKLTRQVGYNPFFNPLYLSGTPSIGDVQEDFEYSGLGGRLSKKISTIGTGAVYGVVEGWTYNTLGLPATHSHPRRPATGTGTPSSLTETTTYTYGRPTSVALSGVDYQGTAISGASIAATYHPAGNLASYAVTQTGATTLTTTILQDSSGLPRPNKISTSAGGFDTGNYTYDAAGNVAGMKKDTNNRDWFTYDLLSRIASANIRTSAATQTQGFSYDRYANLLNVTGTSSRDWSNVVVATNRLPSPNTYDARGNLTLLSSANETLTWDAMNRQVRDIVGTSTDWQYFYDGSDERAVRVPLATAFNNVPRREMARFILEALGQTPSTTACDAGHSPHFTDVPCADPDWGWIQKFYELGYTTGCTISTYCPDNPVSRAEMAVFLLRGEHGPAYVPPACTGTIFNDVPCPSAFAVDWINKLSSEGVTTGCQVSPPLYCPINATLEVQMATFMGKIANMASFHAIWGGSLYTMRDEGNRVTTEFNDSFPYRDNVYLGGVMVASRVSKSPTLSTGEWNFHSSDHLGTVRLSVKGSNGVTVESHKYWPFGDPWCTSYPCTPLFQQRAAFAGMERDLEANHFYDHARTEDYWLGRFVSPDPLAGNTENPQSWNRYSYAWDNPLRYSDPDGRATLDLIFRLAQGDPRVVPVAQGIAFAANPGLHTAIAGSATLALGAPIAMAAPEGMAGAAAFNYLSGVLVGAASSPAEPLKGGAVGGALSAVLGVAGGPGLNILRAGVTSIASQQIVNGEVDWAKVAATTTAAAAANTQVAVATQMGAKPLMQSMIQKFNTALVSLFYEASTAPPPPSPPCPGPNDCR